MATGDSRTVSREEYDKLKKKYLNLQEQYRDLEDKHAKCEQYIRKANAMYRAAKENARQWWAYAEKRGYDLERGKVDADNDLAPATTSGQLEGSHVTSSQSTDANAQDLPLGNQEDTSSDEPEVVSVRSLKRGRRESSRQMPPPVHVKVEPTSPSDPIELGSDDYSSPVLKRHKSNWTETSDLDEHVVYMDTPRKRNARRATSEETVRPLNLLLTTSSLSEGANTGSNDDAVYIKIEAGESIREDPIAPAGDIDLPTSDGFKQNNILRQRSVNVPSSSKNSVSWANVKRNRKLDIGILSEDGYGQASVREGETHTPKPASIRDRRLDTLLDEPSPDRQILPKRPTPEPKILKQVKKSVPANEQQISPANGRSEAGLAVFKTPCGLKESLTPVRPNEEPLRSRAVEKLHLDDFKINPKYLGSDFAFVETFRGREQRRNLQVCSCPDCCGGAFKQAIAMGVAKSGKSDDEALEAYLGPEFAALMSGYNKEKQKEMLVDAHARAFANQHGKHREAFERRSTPPGFWRIDMPSTQEEQQDRERALVMEREKVEHRWREAMRGGRWMFRDE